MQQQTVSEKHVLDTIGHLFDISKILTLFVNKNIDELPFCVLVSVLSFLPLGFVL